ncbi:MAG TPA: protein translocase subunit SecD, partial [Desulfobacter postgatei]|nr:protein translocase subunit SecD [Desulfobacter postgatei]
MRLNFFTIKRVLILGVIVAAVICLLPTFTNTWPHKKINLGLDLQGGMHLVLEVQSEEAVKAELDRTISQLKLDLKNEKIQHMGIDTAPDHKIMAQISGADNKSAVEKLLSEEYAGLEIPSVKNIDGGISFTLRLPDKEADSIKKMATEQAMETIRNRIDEFGVNEPDIRIQSGNRILLQLPGISDPERAKGLIGKTAQLTFQLVDEQGDVNAALAGQPPVGDEILYQVKQNADTVHQSRTPFLIKKHVELDGSHLTNARVEFDQFQQPQVGIEFSRKGARIFERITGANINKRLAIVLDNNVYSAPNIQDRISGGKAVITGHFTLEEATDLAIALRAGSLPAPVKIIEERTVGPTLGRDSVRMGLTSMLIGGALVVLFMAIYYKGAGLVADIALVVNI